MPTKASEEVAGAVADGVEALDGLALVVEGLHIGVHIHAVDDGGQADVAMDAIERRLLDGHIGRSRADGRTFRR